METLSLIDDTTRTISSPQGTYTYELLDFTQNQIRLLQIKPSTSHSDPTISIKSFTLTDDLQYVALSYVWGTDKPSHHIRIENGSTYSGHVLVSENLLDFILMVHGCGVKWEDTWFWIDQISINQDLISERNHQVTRMVDIFSKAQYVLVWLGPVFDGSDKVIANLQSCRVGIRAAIKFDDTEKGQKRRATYWANLAAPVMRFLSLRYWTRLWISQELILGTEVLVHLGRSCFAWDDQDWSHWVSQLSSRLLLPQLIDDTAWQPISRIHLLNINREQWKGHCCEREIRPLSRALFEPGLPSPPDDNDHHHRQYRPRSWQYVLGLSSNATCSIKHDRIYGLMGLVKPSLRVPINYELTIEEVFLSIVRRENASTFDDLKRVGVSYVCASATETALDLWDRSGLGPITSKKALIKFTRYEVLDAACPVSESTIRRLLWHSRLRLDVHWRSWILRWNRHLYDDRWN